MDTTSTTKDALSSLRQQNGNTIMTYYFVVTEIPLVTISFDQTSVNASEGNYAVVCVSAFFMSELAAEQTFFVDVSLGTQGSAGMYNKNYTAIAML